MRSFKDKNIQKKQVDYNSDRLPYLNSCVWVCNHFGRQARNFLIHRNKSDFSTTSIELQKSNINDDDDNNEKTKNLKNPDGNI